MVEKLTYVCPSPIRWPAPTPLRRVGSNVPVIQMLNWRHVVLNCISGPVGVLRCTICFMTFRSIESSGNGREINIRYAPVARIKWLFH